MVHNDDDESSFHLYRRHSSVKSSKYTNYLRVLTLHWANTTWMVYICRWPNSSSLKNYYYNWKENKICYFNFEKKCYFIFSREFWFYNAETLKKCMLFFIFYLEFVSASRSFDKSFILIFFLKFVRYPEINYIFSCSSFRSV